VEADVRTFDMYLFRVVRKLTIFCSRKIFTTWGN